MIPTKKKNSKNLSDDELQAAYDSEFENLPRLSEKISDLSKFVWSGAIALIFAALTYSQDGKSNNFYEFNRSFFLVAAGFGSLAFLFEYCERICAYAHTRKLLAWLESDKRPHPIPRRLYNQRTESAFSRLVFVFFIFKNIMAFASGFVIAFSIMRYIVMR